MLWSGRLNTTRDDQLLSSFSSWFDRAMNEPEPSPSLADLAEVNKAFHKAYQLSMVLLIASLLPRPSEYAAVRDKMLYCLDRMPVSDTRRIWLTGRMLQAAIAMEDKTSQDHCKNEFRSELRRAKYSDEFLTWAYAYFAASGLEEYNDIMPDCMSAAVHMMNTFKSFRGRFFKQTWVSPEDSNRFSQLSSNLMWTLVMNLQAAANANNKEDYSKTLAMFTSINPPILADRSAAKIIEHMIHSSDFPIWALSIARLSAAKMRDNDLYAETTSMVSMSDRKLATLPPSEALLVRTLDIEVLKLLDKIKANNSTYNQHRSP